MSTTTWMTKNEALHWHWFEEMIAGLNKPLEDAEPVEPVELTFEQQECREHEILHHKKECSVSWDELLYYRHIITFDELLKRENDTIE